MRTLPLLILIVISTTALAGCLSSDKEDANGGISGGSTEPGLYRLDCSIGGNGWGEPCLSLASPNASPSKTEIDIVVNPTNPLNVVVAAKDLDPLASPCVWAVPEVTMDGGKTWTSVYIGGKLEERTPGEVLYGWDCITDPIMEFDSQGVLYYNLQVYKLNALATDLGLPAQPDGSLMALAISRDGGLTWPEIIPQFAGDDAAIIPDYMRMGTNPDTDSVFVVWNTIAGLAVSQPTLYAYRGVPVMTPYLFVTPAEPTGLGESSVVGANDGTVYVCLCGFNSGGKAYLTSSTNDGQTFGLATLAFEFVPMANTDNADFRIGTSVELTVDNSGGEFDGCLRAVWGGNEAGTLGGADIYFRSSCDKGATWSDPVLVNSNRDNSQFFPRITVDGFGTIHVAYLTQAYDKNNKLVDGEWAHSTDGGATWYNYRLTKISSDGDLGVHQNGGPFYGDYIGIDSTGGDVWIGFPSTATGVAEIAVAHIARNE